MCTAIIAAFSPIGVFSVNHTPLENLKLEKWAYADPMRFKNATRSQYGRTCN